VRFSRPEPIPTLVACCNAPTTPLFIRLAVAAWPGRILAGFDCAIFTPELFPRNRFRVVCKQSPRCDGTIVGFRSDYNEQFSKTDPYAYTQNYSQKIQALSDEGARATILTESQLKLSPTGNRSLVFYTGLSGTTANKNLTLKYQIMLRVTQLQNRYNQEISLSSVIQNKSYNGGTPYQVVALSGAIVSKYLGIFFGDTKRLAAPAAALFATPYGVDDVNGLSLGQGDTAQQDFTNRPPIAGEFYGMTDNYLVSFGGSVIRNFAERIELGALSII